MSHDTPTLLLAVMPERNRRLVMTVRARSSGPTESTTSECIHSWNWTEFDSQTSALIQSSMDIVDGGSYSSEYDQQSMNDVVTPNFQRLMSQGHIINNPMDRSLVRCEVKPLNVLAMTVHESSTRRHEILTQGDIHPYGALSLVSPTGGAFPYSARLPVLFSEFSDSEIDGKRNQAIAQARTRIEDAPINVWVIAGEARETISTVIRLLKAARFLVSPKRSLIRQYRKTLRNGKFSTWRAFCEARDLWLEIRYGIRPLVREIQNALVALDRLGSKHRTRFSSDEHVLFQEEVKTPDATDFFGQFGCLQATIRGTIEQTVSARAGVLVEPRFAELGVAELIGAGNIISGLWDLVPYSFVVDWFANVGDVLSSWAPNAGFVTPLASWVVVRNTVHKYTEVVPGTLSPSPSILGGCNAVSQDSSCLINSGGSAHVWETTHERVPNPSVSLRVTIKDDFNLGAARIADLVALATQFISYR